MENKIAIFKDAETILEVPVSTEEKTVWLNRQQMSALFDRDVKTIGKHINNAMREELEGQVVVAKFATTTRHGAMKGKTQTQQTEYYNLDVIISVGYRVKSKRGIAFRKWANSVLTEYIIKGYAINDQPKNHSFSDGNKRIAATIFLYFLDKNGILYNEDSSKRIADHTLCSTYHHDCRVTDGGKRNDDKYHHELHLRLYFAPTIRSGELRSCRTNKQKSQTFISQTFAILFRTRSGT